MFQMSIYVTSFDSYVTAAVGTSVVDMQVAVRWKSSQMPAHYAKASWLNGVRLHGLRMEGDENLTALPQTLYNTL